jgi:hypothetical protein
MPRQVFPYAMDLCARSFPRVRQLLFGMLAR